MNSYKNVMIYFIIMPGTTILILNNKKQFSDIFIVAQLCAVIQNIDILINRDMSTCFGNIELLN